MTEFRSPPEEVERMLSELESVKEAIRALAGRVAAIDKHLRRVYQVPSASRRGRSSRQPAVPSADREAILGRFDSLRSLYMNHGAEAVENPLKAIGEDDLRDLARELGLPNSRKGGVQRLRDLITQRLRESSLLGVGSVLRGPEERGRTEAAETTASGQLSGPDADPDSGAPDS